MYKKIVCDCDLLVVWKRTCQYDQCKANGARKSYTNQKNDRKYDDRFRKYCLNFNQSRDLPNKISLIINEMDRNVQKLIVFLEKMLKQRT